MNRSLTLQNLFLFCSLFSAALGAQEIVNFEDDSITKGVAPKHFFLGPNTPNEKDRLHSGYVELSFMVGEAGVAERISIVYSSHSRFHENAIAALKRYEFEPARIDGKAVPSKSRSKIFFDAKVPTIQRRSGRRLSGGRKDGETTAMFYELHDTFQKLSSKMQPDITRMQRLIISMARLHTLDTVAQTYLSIDRYLLSLQENQLTDQARALMSALYFDSKIRLKYYRLNQEKVDALETKLQKIYLAENRLAEAMNNQHRLTQTRPKVASKFGNAMQTINSIGAQKKPFARWVELDSRGRSFQTLFHRGFEIQNIDGAVENLAIRCETKYTELVYQIGSYISLPEAWGECEAEVIGKPGSMFEFVEG